jgi:hypothetical protein
MTLKTSLLCLILASSASANDVIKDVMKKCFKPEDAVAKKVGKGEASDSEISALIAACQKICAETPSRGDKAEWVKKCQAMVNALKKVQAKDSSGSSEFKKAVNCKACHDVFKGK